MSNKTLLEHFNDEETRLHLSTSLIIIVAIALSFVLTLYNVGFDINKFDIVSSLINGVLLALIGNMARVALAREGTAKGKKVEEIKSLDKDLFDIKNAIDDENLNDKLDIEIIDINKGEKVKSYLEYLTDTIIDLETKKDKLKSMKKISKYTKLITDLKDKRTLVHEYKKDIHNEEIDFNVDDIRIEYQKITLSFLYSGVKRNKDKFIKEVDPTDETIKQGALFNLLTFVLGFALVMVTVSSDIPTGEKLQKLAIYLFTIMQVSLFTYLKAYKITVTSYLNVLRYRQNILVKFYNKYKGVK